MRKTNQYYENKTKPDSTHSVRKHCWLADYPPRASEENHVPQVYQGVEGVTTFVASFKEYPPRSVPPSFNPANMMEDTLRDIKAKQKLERAFPMLRDELAGEKKEKGREGSN
jgi:hypothetical protein